MAEPFDETAPAPPSEKVWRLIDTGELDGPSNMAVDEALLAGFDPERSLPVLRLYGWNPPALSLGRYQDAAFALNLARCREDGVPVVRRMTGGGIIYHAQELTYSIVCAPGHLAVTGVREGFRRLCGFLLEGYRRLGLDPHFAAELNDGGERLGARTTFCFAGKEECDIVVAGRKLGGNAQRRMRNAILQHGSIPLKNLVPQGLRYLNEPAPGAEKAASLADFGLHPSRQELIRVLVPSFEAGLQVRLRCETLDPEERETATRLAREKYLRPEWNLAARER